MSPRQDKQTSCLVILTEFRCQFEIQKERLGGNVHVQDGEMQKLE